MQESRGLEQNEAVSSGSKVTMMQGAMSLGIGSSPVIGGIGSSSQAAESMALRMRLQETI